MRKHTLLLVSGAMIAFASCNSSNDNKANSQATIDSLANVKAAEIQAQVQAKNDSTIKAVAQAKADSIMNYEKGVAKGKMEANATKKHTDNTKAKTTKQETAPANEKDSKFNRMGGNAGTSNANGNATQQPDPQKDDKFKRMGGK